MLKLGGFCVLVVQLSLATEMNADWSVRKTSFGSNMANRTYLQMNPTRLYPLPPDHGDAEIWPADSDTESKQTSAVNPIADLLVTEAQVLSMSDTPGQTVTYRWNPALPDLSSPNQMGPACVTDMGFIEEAVPVDLTQSDSFRFSHNDTFETEGKSHRQLMTHWKHDTKYSHQTIVIMEDDPAVIESATYFFERQTSASTLLEYKKGALHTLRGNHSFSTGNHDVILVGHGSKNINGTVQLSGYGPEEVARFVSALKSETIFGHIGTISLISCNLGNDRHFMLRLLQVLHSLRVEAQLHLYESILSVSSEGEIMTSTDGVWRSHDHSKRAIAELDQRGDLLRKVEAGCAGPVFPDYKGNVLYLQTLEWPNHPQMFVPLELRKKYPSIVCLEGLTWSLFFEDSERRRAPNYDPNKNQRNVKAIWCTEPEVEEDTIIFRHIVTIQDLLVEIRYNAREEIASDLYYVVNECIYKVHGKNLSIDLVGKFMSADNEGEIEHFRQTFGGQQGRYSLSELREGLKPSKFNDFCRQTFQFQQCSYNCERWGHYFMVAVFAASVRNFRTFSLFLMSVIGCEVGHLRGIDSPLCTAFVGDHHPMVTDQPGPGNFRRGFYGCTIDNFEMAPQDRQIWLDEVVAKENYLYVKSKQLMSVRFSSYLEYFRGTPEGKKLKRGCVQSLNKHLNV
ncbi:hypothetical protein Q5P01_017937 [Channa striata]|uniref:Peptidase C80 domain-containing protein n=1 Tax=Channa striata TaxID=64152 RepID=A0AA88M4C5_CHASR|nr:hypothetical protein Q5P01_017937 [Channa striata]